MKRMWLVAGFLVVLLVFGNFAVFGEQVTIGDRTFFGQALTIGVRLEQDDSLNGKVYLPCSGYLYAFYQGAPSAEQYLILPNLKNQGNYYNAGVIGVSLPMLFVTGNEQKLRFLFSPQRLLRTDFCGIEGDYPSVQEIEKRGLWYTVQNSIWVGEVTIPTVFSPARPYWCSIRIQSWPCRPPRPVPSYCCYKPRPLPTTCCPSPCAAIFWYWLFMGILLH